MIVVDDDPESLHSLTHYFIRAGYEVIGYSKLHSDSTPAGASERDVVFLTLGEVRRGEVKRR